MWKRLRSLLPRRRRLLFWTAVVVAVATPLVIGIVLLGAMALRIHLQIDVGLILFALAAVLVSWIAFLIVRYRLQPKQAVTVGYNYKLIQPALPLSRYLFRLEIFYELDSKGDRQTFQQGTIELRFRAKDHPDMLAWCCSQVSTHLSRHRELATARFPAARVLLAPEPTTRELEADKRWREVRSLADEKEHVIERPVRESRGA
jgi:hypothetical protein